MYKRYPQFPIVDTAGGLLYTKEGWFNGVPADFVPGVICYFNEFSVPSDYVPGDWDSVGGGTASFQEEDPSFLRLSTGAGVGDTIALFLKDSYRTIDAGQRMWFSCRVKLNSIVNTTMICGFSDGSANNLIAIRLGAGSDDIIGRCVAGTNITDIVLADLDISADWATLSFVSDGTQVDFYIDYVHKGTITTNIPNTSLQLRTAFQVTSVGGGVRSLDIDYFYSANDR